MPLGVGLTFMPIIAAATSGVPAHEAGLASGLITTSQQMGGSLGLAILSGIATSASAATGSSALQTLIHAYDDGFLAAVVFPLLALFVAVTVIRQRSVTVVETVVL